MWLMVRVLTRATSGKACDATQRRPHTDEILHRETRAANRRPTLSLAVALGANPWTCGCTTGTVQRPRARGALPLAQSERTEPVPIGSLSALGLPSTVPMDHHPACVGSGKAGMTSRAKVRICSNISSTVLPTNRVAQKWSTPACAKASTFAQTSSGVPIRFAAT
jgi:hypothetical protein